MKIRNGFVSNSSSSSFVVAFPKEIDSIETMGKVLFRGVWEEQGYVNPYPDPDSKDPGSTIYSVAEKVYEDYIEKQKCNKEDLKKHIERIFEDKNYIILFDDTNLENLANQIEDNDLLNVCIDIINFKKNNPDKYKNGKYIKGSGYYEKQEYKLLDKKKDNIQQKIAKNECKQFLKVQKDFVVLPLIYSDNDGQLGRDMEHGDIFSNLVHIKVSQH